MHSCLEMPQRIRSDPSIGECGKGCGHMRGSSGVAYADSYCDKLAAHVLSLAMVMSH